MNRPQPQILIIWRIQLALYSFLPAFLISLFFRIGSMLWTAAAVFFALIFLVLYLIYFPLLYRRVSFGIKNGNILLNTGVIYNRTIALPISEITFVTVTGSVLSRPFGIFSVIAVAPGAKLRIQGLKRSDADNLALVLRQNG